ncbi:unnamed protein product, partial [Amoebophrya sp. A25]
GKRLGFAIAPPKQAGQNYPWSKLGESDVTHFFLGEERDYINRGPHGERGFAIFPDVRVYERF